MLPPMCLSLCAFSAAAVNADTVAKGHSDAFGKFLLSVIDEHLKEGEGTISSQQRFG